MDNKEIRPLAPGEKIKNRNGTYSSELSLTVQIDNKWVNIPSLWMIDGVVHPLNEEQAIAATKYYENKSGKKAPRFDLLETAEKAAELRSKSGGAYTKELFQ